MSEKNVYRRFYEHAIRRGYDRIDRIENGVIAGMPDINLCINGRESWIELKAPTEPKRSSTPLFGSNHKISQDQLNWFKRQIDAGGRAFLLIVTDYRWMLIHGAEIDGVNQKTTSQLVEIALWHATESLLRTGRTNAWHELRSALINLE